MGNKEIVLKAMDELFHERDPKALNAIGITPIGREAVPDEIAFGVLYLASDESSYTIGSEMVIDGGNTAV